MKNKENTTKTATSALFKKTTPNTVDDTLKSTKPDQPDKKAPNKERNKAGEGKAPLQKEALDVIITLKLQKSEKERIRCLTENPSFPYSDMSKLIRAAVMDFLDREEKILIETEKQVAKIRHRLG